jgi:dihydropteroate synthase
MGILNVTPDSFSDGGRFLWPADAVAQARRMIDEGADVIDIGGESTRPGSHPVQPAEQIDRVVPVIEGIRQFWTGLISVDTTSFAVAHAAFESGANWVNDVSALRDDPDMAGLCAERGCPVVLMHMLWSPRTMQVYPEYQDVVLTVEAFLLERAEFAKSSGIVPDRIIIDPGIGFGKTLGHNLALLSNLPRLVAHGYPVLVGASRKSFIGTLAGGGVGDRLAGSLAAAVIAVRNGAAIVRVHDVGPTRRALSVATAIQAGRS